MKNISLLCFLFSLSAPALAQEIVIDTSYYTPPPLRRRVLTADPDESPTPRRSNRVGGSLGGRRSDNPLFQQLREVNTWYVSAEGGFRSDGSVLTNTFSGLVSSVTQTKTNWGALVGYTHHNAWAIETGYVHTPTHLNITIQNNQKPLVFNNQNSGYGIPLRIKRRIGSGKNSVNGTGFWITAGAWLVPNGDGQMDDFKLIGNISRTSGRTRVVDTLRLSNKTTTVNRVTGLAELGIDYATRLSPFLELGFYARKYWGLGNALRSDIIYTINNKSEQQSTITSNGSGWGFGIALRYIYGRQHEVKKALN